MKPGVPAMFNNSPRRSHRFYLWIAGILLAFLFILVAMGALLNLLVYVAIRLFMFSILVLVAVLLWAAIKVRVQGSRST